ncbi:MAG: hypothetical protein ACOC2F_03120 [Bacteroidota bacterium]
MDIMITDYPGKIRSIAFIIIICFSGLNNKLNAQDSIFIEEKTKLFKEFCFSSQYSFARTRTINNSIPVHARGLLNLGFSFGIHYPLNKNNLLGVKTAYRQHTLAFDYTLQKKMFNLPYDFYGPFEYPIHVIDFQLIYTKLIALGEKYALPVQLGSDVAIPIIINQQQNTVSYLEKQQQITVLATNVYPHSPVPGFCYSLGIQRPIKTNILRIACTGRIPFNQKRFIQYKFFPESDVSTSTGKIISGLGYVVGIQISYHFK